MVNSDLHYQQKALGPAGSSSQRCRAGKLERELGTFQPPAGLYWGGVGNERDKMPTDLINKGMFRASGFRNKPIFTGKSLPKNKNRNTGLLVNIGLYGELKKN